MTRRVLQLGRFENKGAEYADKTILDRACE